MAAEHNLISASQYARLMKIKKKLDDESNNKKKDLLTDTKKDELKDRPRDTGKDDSSHGTDEKPIGDAYHEANLEDNTAFDNFKDSKGQTVKDMDMSLDVKESGTNVKDVVDDGKHLRDKSIDDKSDVKPHVKRKRVKYDNIETVVAQFSDALRRKVKRLIIYMFRFGRDISIEDGILSYKKEKLGSVVPLIKSLFGVTPPLPGVGKLRRVLFILSVPSDLFTLSTNERKQIDKYQKEQKNDPIDWIKY
jgi:hypothetical protein